MRVSVLLTAACIMLCLCLLPSSAQCPPNGWVLLHTSVVTSEIRQTITLPPGTPRSTALRVIAKGGNVGIKRLIVAYGNGQMHFETRPENATILLRDGERTREIDRREESRIIEAVTLELDPATRTAPWSKSSASAEKLMLVCYPKTNPSLAIGF